VLNEANKYLGPVALKSAVYNGSNPSLFSTTYSWTKVALSIYVHIGSQTPIIYS